MDVKFAVVEKRINSTFIPQSFTATYQCVIKEGCSVLNPVISLNIGLLNNPTSYNYAQIESFSRYYYIKNWTFSDSLWHAEMQVDVLASHKADILASSAYVVRCSKYSDGNIIDTFYPAKTDFDASTTYWINGNKNTPWASVIQEGMYVVGIINDDENSMGAISYYAFTPLQFATLKHALLSDSHWTGIETTNPDIGLNLYKSLFNPFQYIASINWFPFSVTPQGVEITSITLGWWVLPGIHCYRLGSFLWAVEKNIEFTAHGLAYLRGNYLNIAPYSSYTLYAPPFGELELDALKFANATYNDSGIGHITCTINVDLISGQGILKVTVNGDPSVVVLKVTTQIAVPIQMAQLYSEHNIGSTIATNVNAGIQESKTLSNIINNALDFNFDDAYKESKALKSMAQMVTDANSIGTIHLAQIGSNGSIAQYSFPFCLVCTHKKIVDADEFEFGNPYCRSGELSHYSPGFVQTLNAHVYSNAYATELSNINSLLDGGVFLE